MLDIDFLNILRPYEHLEHPYRRLFEAITLRNSTQLQSIIHQGVDLNTSVPGLGSPLSWAVRIPHNEECVELLLINGADPLKKGNQAISPFHWCVIDDTQQLAKVMIPYMDLKEIHQSGLNLNWFCEGEKYSLLKEWFTQNPEISADWGQNEIHLQLFNDELNLEKIENYPQKINSADYGGWTPLHLAIFSQGSCENWQQNIETLLENGADPFLEPPKGLSPFTWAVLKGNRDAVGSFLLHHYPEVQINDILARPLLDHNQLYTLDDSTLCALKSEFIGSDVNGLFSEFVRQKGYSTQLEGIHFTPFSIWSNTPCVQGIKDWSGFHFKNCDFLESNLTDVYFDGRFEHCLFFNVQAQNIHFLDHSTLSHSTLMNSNFNQAYFHGTAWNNCETLFTSFEQGHFKDCHIKASFSTYGNFLNAHMDQVNIDTWVIHNSAFLDGEAYPSGAEIIGEMGPKITTFADLDHLNYFGEGLDGPTTTGQYRIKQYGGIPVNISKSVDFVDHEALDAEVSDILSHHIQAHEPGRSIAQQVLDYSSPQIQLIKEKALFYAQSTDALYLPGGSDIHPEFYGESRENSTYPLTHYSKDLMEFALIEAMHAEGKPIMGICRGNQIINVYFGGSLHQNVEGHFEDDPQPIEVVAHDGLLGSEFCDESIAGVSMHHQAIKVLAPNLETVAQYDGVIKAAQGSEHQPIFLLQFHPEYQMDPQNNAVWKKFMNLAKEQKSTQSQEKVLSIDDILIQEDAILDGPQSIPPVLIADPCVELSKEIDVDPMWGL